MDIIGRVTVTDVIKALGGVIQKVADEGAKGEGGPHPPGLRPRSPATGRIRRDSEKKADTEACMILRWICSDLNMQPSFSQEKRGMIF